MIIEYSLCSDVGRVRRENQDCLFVSDGDTRIYGKHNHIEHHNIVTTDLPMVLAVFDGMGGEQEGATASYIAAWVTSEFVENKSDVNIGKICITANRCLCDYMEKNGIKSMGTTAVMLRLTDKKAFFCNIGDSSAFKISSEEIKEISIKHIMDINGNGRVLTQHLGVPEAEMQIEPYCVTLKPQDGDVFLLCSDGLTDVLSEKEIKEIVAETPIKFCSKKLVDTAIQKGSKDNISAIVVKITEEGIL